MAIASAVCVAAAGLVVSQGRADGDHRRRLDAGELVLDASDGTTLVLTVEPFTVTGPATQYVVEGAAGPRVAAPPADAVRLFRGRVDGWPASRVFIAQTARGVTGTVALGPGEASYRVNADDDGRLRLSTAPSDSDGGAPPSIFCGADEPATAAAAIGPTDPPPPLRVLELAVDTDYDFLQLFDGDLAAAQAYAIELIGAVDDIYRRDLNIHLELTFLRIWDSETKLFLGPDPLSAFRIYWNLNMDAVPRDVALFLTGRRDIDYGGRAYVASACDTEWAYAVAGYLQGSFAGVDTPSVHNWDLGVTAHELGHTVGSLHTHIYGLDSCDDPDAAPRRGSIMSYCPLSVSGGNAVRDMRFHTTVRDVIHGYFDGEACLFPDCNDNGIDDAIDALVEGADENLNGVPDDCEDCNDNGTLDDEDIMTGTSVDVDGDGIPDECEPDCNGNGTPDDYDIQFGASTDLYGDGIPDECEADCDSSGVSDYVAIQANMAIDVNRNAIPDACEDCDGDGTTDAEAFGPALSCWIASLDLLGEVRAFHPETGVLVNTTVPGLVADGRDVVIDDAGFVYVTSGLDDRVARFDAAGLFVGDFVAAGAGGLDDPAGMCFGPDGDLFVASMGTDSVIRYDAVSGLPLGDFTGSGTGGLVDPFGVAFGPDGNLYITSDDADDMTPDDGQVLVFDGASGAFVDVFVSAADNGGLDTPRGIVFHPHGNLLVASYGSDEILEYDGTTGAFVGRFNDGGNALTLTLDQPWGLRYGPGGLLYVVRHNVDLDKGFDGLEVARVYAYDGISGAYRRTYVLGNDTGLVLPTGIAFMPDFGLDCNGNLRHDGCDIAEGLSRDMDGNGVPDECENDCNMNGVPDVMDIAGGDSLDCNANGIPDECDIADGTSTDTDENEVPDECQPQGGCCFVDGSCTDGTDLGCANAGGVFQGDGVACVDVVCEPHGACCADDGTCTFGSAADCAAAGGVYQGDTIECDAVTCVPRGACCFTDGNCTFGFAADCGAAGGTYQGDAVTCVEANCVPEGACCFTDGSCTFGSAADCGAAGGTYQGDTVTCVEANCVPEGACCFTDGSCTFGPAGDCGAAGGIYQGNAVTCVEANCVPEGACCFTDGSCTFGPAGDCGAAGGSYQGDTVTCLAAACVAEGACCFTDGSCTFGPAADCGAAGGSYQGDTATCVEANCVSEGACCFTDGSCTFGPAADCDAAGGTYQDDTVTCVEVDCVPTGACCFPTGKCAIQTEVSCDAAGGVFAGPDVTCSAAPCNVAGACCLPAGSCTFVTALQCATIGGVFEGDGVFCGTIECVPLGACCMPDGACTSGPAADCGSAGGVYQGDGTTCGSVTCPIVGACCLEGGGCTFVSPATCVALGGAYQGDGVACNAVQCIPEGACCLDTGTCFFDTAAACVAAGGDYRGDGVDCVAAACPPLGTCCLPDTSCLEMTAPECVDAGGAYIGDGAACATTDCVADCDDSGVADAIEIAQGAADDCNGNGVPDTCDVATPLLVVASADLGPIGAGSPQAFLLPTPPPAFTTVAISLAAFANLDADDETFSVDLNGAPLGSVFENGRDCPPSRDTANIYLAAGTYNDLVAGGDALITVTASDAVDAAACDGNSVVAITVRYVVAPTSPDEDEDGIPDECVCPADVNGDGVVNVSDLVEVITGWGPCDNCPADIDGDGTVAVGDLVEVITQWGPC